MEQLQYLKPSLCKRQKRRDKRLDEELIECYRIGWRTKNYKRGHKEQQKKNQYEHARSHESMKLMHKGGTKTFNDNLEPLLRYLVSHVGKNWNKVHGELCKQLKKNTVSGLHVFNHLFDYVQVDVKIENKKVYYFRFGKYEELRSTERAPKFYINEQTGQLMKATLITNKERRRQWQS